MPKILVADDDKVMLGLLKTLMEMEGNEVVVDPAVVRPDHVALWVKLAEARLHYVRPVAGGVDEVAIGEQLRERL